MHSNILPILLFCVLIFPCRPALAADPSEHVIVLHGLWRTHRSMDRLAQELENAGFKVVNKGYPSTDHPVETLADAAVSDAVAECRRNRAQTIHFVTHSMGGILVRSYLKDHQLPELGRVVMISPPNQGSEIVDAFKSLFFFKWLFGPAGQQLGTKPDNLPNRLGPVDFPLGVIAGNFSFNPLLSMIIPGDDDSRVAVKRTKVAGMADFIQIDASHSFIMRNEKAISQAIAFLKTGRFQQDAFAK